MSPRFLPIAAVALSVGALLARPLLAGTDLTLKEAAHGRFLIGAAINDRIVQGEEPAAAHIVEREFNAISPENCLKWAVVHPEPGRYDFTRSDAYVDFGVKHGLFIVGHTLMWHYQTPAWVFYNADGSLKSRAQVLAELRDHIRTVVGRYKGRIKGWDVVNEAFDDSGKLRTDRPWYKILGEDGILAAFKAAHEADPKAELYYNDFSLWLPAKRRAVIALVEKIRAAGLRIDGVGMQEHYLMSGPSPQMVGQVIDAFANAKIPVMVTELDISVLPRPNHYTGADLGQLQAKQAEFDPYVNGLPVRMENALADRYAAMFAVYRAHAEDIKRVTFWGVSDGDSWLNNWPIRGRHDYPLLFDRHFRPKPAFFAVMKALDHP